MKVRDKINEIAHLISDAGGFQAPAVFDFSAFDNPSDDVHFYLIRAVKIWAAATATWEKITGSAPDLEADFDDDEQASEEPEPEQIKIWKILDHYLYQHGDSWSVREDLESSWVLTTDTGVMEYEPGPSHRTDDSKDFNRRFRFPTKETALAALKKYCARLNEE